MHIPRVIGRGGESDLYFIGFHLTQVMSEGDVPARQTGVA